ncbi:MAG: hypothetical protein ACYDEX_02240 [Mobilitalea sp.]
MKRNILRITDDGVLVFDGFDKMRSNQLITVKIFGYRKVVISLTTPDHVLECHNIITVTDHRCFAPGLVAKLNAAGIESNTYFVFTTDSYSISM